MRARNKFFKCTTWHIGTMKKYAKKNQGFSCVINILI